MFISSAINESVLFYVDRNMTVEDLLEIILKNMYTHEDIDRVRFMTSRYLIHFLIIIVKLLNNF